MVERKRATALAMVDSKLHAHEAWMQAGSAVEYALKALIHRRERFNAWPSKSARPELHTHDLRKLCAMAGVDVRRVPRHLRGSLKTVLDWDRSHEYTGARMSRANARSMVEAAFADTGIVAWLRTL